MVIRIYLPGNIKMHLQTLLMDQVMGWSMDPGPCFVYIPQLRETNGTIATSQMNYHVIELGGNKDVNKDVYTISKISRILGTRLSGC